MISIHEEQRVFLLALHKKIDEAGSRATKALFPESSPGAGGRDCGNHELLKR
jgi:hypothetical protein